jgi:hypothetical protein
VDRKVCESLKIAKPYFREMDMDPINGEPLCAEYLTLKDGMVIPDREEGDDRNTGVKKRTDIGFRGRRRAILVDCTTCSPLAKDVKDYKPGKTADAGTKRKMKECERVLFIQRKLYFLLCSRNIWWTGKRST